MSWSEVATTSASSLDATYSTALLNARSYAQISPTTAPASFACAAWSTRPALDEQEKPSSLSCSANRASRTASAASSMVTSDGASKSSRDGVAPFLNPARPSPARSSISYARCESANRPRTRGPNRRFAKGAALAFPRERSPEDSSDSSATISATTSRRLPASRAMAYPRCSASAIKSRASSRAPPRRKRVLPEEATGAAAEDHVQIQAVHLLERDLVLVVPVRDVRGEGRGRRVRDARRRDDARAHPGKLRALHDGARRAIGRRDDVAL